MPESALPADSLAALASARELCESLSSAEGGSIIVFREVQNGGQLFGRQSLQPQQVPLTPRPAYRKIIEYHQTPFRSRLTFSCLSGESICIRDPIQFTANPL